MNEYNDSLIQKRFSRPTIIPVAGVGINGTFSYLVQDRVRYIDGKPHIQPTVSLHTSAHNLGEITVTGSIKLVVDGKIVPNTERSLVPDERHQLTSTNRLLPEFYIADSPIEIIDGKNPEIEVFATYIIDTSNGSFAFVGFNDPERISLKPSRNDLPDEGEGGNNNSSRGGDDNQPPDNNSPDDLDNPDIPLIPCWLRKNFPDLFPRQSPIVLDLNSNDTIDYINRDDSTAYFDFTVDDFAVHTAWIGNGDGFLAYDRNADGIINNVTELFGFTEDSGAYDKLALLNSNGDAVIDANDPEFANLLVWVDEDQDGFSAPWELQTLAQAGITTLGLEVNLIPEENQQLGDGLITETSYFIFENGIAKQTADVFFNNDPLNSLYVGEFELNEAVFDIPYIRGYGLLADLPIAASQDDSLLQTAEEFINLDPRDIFAINLKLDRLLYQWAGSLERNPANKIRFVDERKLGFIEKLLVRDADIENGIFFVGAFSGVGNIYDIAKSEIAKGLLIEGVYQNQLAGFEYNPFSDEVLADFQELADAIAALEQVEPFTPSEQALFWTLLTPTLLAAQQSANLDDFDARLTSAIAGSGLTLDDLKNPHYAVIFDETVLEGDINGNERDEIIINTSGNRYIQPGFGSDLVYWGNGDGDDILLEFGAIEDVDTLYVELNVEDIAFIPNYYDLIIKNNSTGEELKIIDHFKVANGNNRNGVERIIFNNADFTNVELIAEINTTTSSDNILTGSDDDDYLVLSGGNDRAYGHLGSDRYDVYLNGHHLIDDRAGNSTAFTDRVYLYDVLPSEVTVQSSFSDIVINFGTEASITLTAQLLYHRLGTIEEVHFVEDGTVWNADQLESAVI